MTYKAIVKRMVENEATNWLEKVLKENDINYKYTITNDTIFENEKDTFLYKTEIEIRISVYTVSVVVGGTVDDTCGICTSVIWNDNHKILWMNTEEARKALGIEKFEI